MKRSDIAFNTPFLHKNGYYTWYASSFAEPANITLIEHLDKANILILIFKFLKLFSSSIHHHFDSG